MTKGEKNSKEVLRNEFIKQFDSDLDLYKNISEASNVGAPMFDEHDLYETKSVLHRLLRFFFIKKKITNHRLKTASANYDKFMQIESINTINTNWTNIIKILKSGKYKNGLTYNKLNHILSNILGYAITDVKITTQNVYTKEEVIVSLSEIEEYLKNKRME